MKRFVILFFMFLTFAGCMMEPYEQAFDEDSGPYPEKYLTIINTYLDSHMENPDSVANLTIIKPPEKIVLKDHQESISLAKGHEVWEIFLAFDAKNRNGKMVRDFHVIWIRNNRIVAFDYDKPDLGYRFEHRFEPVSPSEEDAKETTAEPNP